MGAIMAKAAAPELDKPELKKMFNMARNKGEPMNCAVAMIAGKPFLKIDKIKKKQAILKEMEDEYGKLDMGRWGEVTIDKAVDG